MRCPYCQYEDSKVIDSRPSEDKKRRRRECRKCGKRFTTYEIVEKPLRIVIKRDGSLEQYDRNKLLAGIYHAIKKRPVSYAQVNEIADCVEDKYNGGWNSQMTSAQIGTVVLEQLQDIDEIAYIRFASVYQDFKDASSFISAIAALNDKSKKS